MRVAVFRVDMTRRGDGHRNKPRKDCPRRAKRGPGREIATVERRAARVSSLRRKPLRKKLLPAGHGRSYRGLAPLGRQCRRSAHPLIGFRRIGKRKAKAKRKEKELEM